MNNFYWENYIKMYPELKKNVVDLVSAWNHLNNYGFKENKFFCKYLSDYNFDWEYYIDLYDDLKNNEINTKETAINHWKVTGKKEGRLIANLEEKIIFNWKKYINTYMDLQNVNINTSKLAWYHWNNQGRYEGRIFFHNIDYNINFYFENYVYIYKYIKLECTNNIEGYYNHWLQNMKTNN